MQENMPFWVVPIVWSFTGLYFVSRCYGWSDKLKAKLKEKR